MWLVGRIKKSALKCTTILVCLVAILSGVKADDLPLIPIPPGDPHEMVTLPGEAPGPRQLATIGCKKEYTVSIFQREIDHAAPIVIRATITGVTQQEHGLRPNQEISVGTFAFVRVDEVIKGDLPKDVILHVAPPFGQHNICFPKFAIGETGIISGQLKPSEWSVPPTPGSYEARFRVLLTSVEAAHD